MHRHQARFKVVDAGRRWGKTRLGVNECIDVAAKGGRAWWVSPSYKTSEVGWRPLRRVGSKLGAEVRRGDRMIILPGGGSVTVRSADNPESLVGEGLDFIVMDESGIIKERAWFESLRPALSDRQGRAMFIGTPKGMNWFWRLWSLGNSGEDEDWASWCFPTSSNPYIPPEEIDAAQRDLPDRIFRQEYLAEFIDDAGGVFRGVMAAATADPQSQAIEGHRYVFGVDWAQKIDFTVVAVLDATMNALVHIDRFNQIDYHIQLARLQSLYEKFKPSDIIAEQNSMGGPLVEELQYMNLPVMPFVTTMHTKMDAVRALALAFERQDITIINDPVLIGELQAYEQKQLLTGWRFEAPEGMHDDTVIASMLAWWAVSGANAGPAVVELW